MENLGEAEAFQVERTKPPTVPRDFCQFSKVVLSLLSIVQLNSTG